MSDGARNTVPILFKTLAHKCLQLVHLRRALQKVFTLIILFIEELVVDLIVGCGAAVVEDAVRFLAALDKIKVHIHDLIDKGTVDTLWRGERGGNNVVKLTKKEGGGGGQTA
jgi:hypothetical protein